MRQLKIQQSITRREDQSIDKYLNEISKIPLLRTEEEAELAKQAREGSKEALDTLVKANLRFVVSVAKQYQDQGLSLNDLINEGNIGPIKAAQKFDETKGFKFISFAVRGIRQSIIKALIDKSRIIRLPMNKNTEIIKTQKALIELLQSLERDPLPEELAEYLEISIDKVKEALSFISMNTYGGKHLSLDAPFEEGEEYGLLHVLDNGEKSPDYDIVGEGFQIEIKNILKQFKDREREILTMFYGLDGNDRLALEEIGNKLGKEKEYVRQIRNKAKKKLIRLFQGLMNIKPATQAKSNRKNTKDKKSQYNSKNIGSTNKIDYSEIISSWKEKYKNGITLEDLYENTSMQDILQHIVDTIQLSKDQKEHIISLGVMIGMYSTIDKLNTLLSKDKELYELVYNGIDDLNTILTNHIT